MLFQSNFVVLWNILGDYTVLKNSYTGQYLLWPSLSAITNGFQLPFYESLQEMVSHPFSVNCIFLKASMRVFSFSITLKADFRNNVLLQIFSLVESFCMEIRALLAATFQELLPLVSFLGISLNILTIFSKNSNLDVWMTSEFCSIFCIIAI